MRIECTAGRNLCARAYYGHHTVLLRTCSPRPAKLSGQGVRLSRHWRNVNTTSDPRLRKNEKEKKAIFEPKTYVYAATQLRTQRRVQRMVNIDFPHTV